jgi:hypothetical protein
MNRFELHGVAAGKRFGLFASIFCFSGKSLPAGHADIFTAIPSAKNKINHNFR